MEESNDTVVVPGKGPGKGAAIAAAVVVTALLAGGGAYAYEKSQATKTQNDLQAQIDALKAQVSSSPTAVATATPAPSATVAPTASPDPTATWKSYTDASYGISFKYPSTWLAPSPTGAKSVPGNEPVSFTAQFAYVKTQALGEDVTVVTSSFSDMAGTVATQLANLRAVYANRAVTSKDINDYPGDINAGSTGYTEPTYIESSDGGYRGVYWYADQRQNDPVAATDRQKLDHLFIYLTDGSSHLVEFVIGASSASAYSAATCTVTGHAGCDLSSELVANLEAIYKPLINTIAAK